MNWVRDEELETISDKIRRGEPVGFLQALAAIDYQTEKQKHARENTWWRRLLRRITSPTPPDQEAGRGRVDRDRKPGEGEG